MNTYDATPVEKTERIGKLVAHLYAKLPEIDYGVLQTDGRTAYRNEACACVCPYTGKYSHYYKARRADCGKFHDCAQRLPDLPGIFL